MATTSYSCDDILDLIDDWDDSEAGGLYSLESSANNAILEPCPTYSGMSLMHTRNRRGPRMDPCGTPEVTGSQSERVPSKATR